MRLVNSKFGLDISFEENRAVSVVIENKKAMTEIISNLWKQSNGQEGQFVLSENNQELKISKEIDMVINPFSLRLNDKRVLNTLYCNLESNSELYVEEKEDINSKIISYIEKIVIMEPYGEIEYNLELDERELFKLYNIRFHEESLSIVEMILDYIKILSALLGMRIFIFLGLDMFFDCETINQIIHQANYNKVQIMLISSCELVDIQACDVHIIDKDRCVIKKVT